jgi:hypothetical protein
MKFIDFTEKRKLQKWIIMNRIDVRQKRSNFREQMSIVVDYVERMDFFI